MKIFDLSSEFCIFTSSQVADDVACIMIREIYSERADLIKHFAFFAVVMTVVFLSEFSRRNRCLRFFSDIFCI